MRTRRLLCWVVALACVPAVPALAQKKAPKGAAKVLLLTGGARNHHGYRDQAFYLAGALEDTGRFEVTLAEDASILESPALRKYDLVIVNADRRDDEFKFTEPQQRALFDYVKSGHGYVSIHGADNAAMDWLPEWREMLGGVFSHFGLPDSKTRKGTYTIKVVKTDDPITRGLAEFEVKDELYYNLQMQPGVEPLATTEFDGKAWPVAWTRTFGRGRVFHTPLGHRDFGPGKDDPLRNPQLLKLVIQGIDWVAEGRGNGDVKTSANPAAAGSLVLFDGKTLDGWKMSGSSNSGAVAVEDGTIVMKAGKPMTGITSTRADLPKTNYELSYEAERLDGSDFFAAATFPVGNSFITFVNGGWGGSVTGLSCLDGADASENNSSRYFKYRDKTWYKFRVRVTGRTIRCRIDDEEVAAIDYQDRHISTRLESRANQPLGFATWESTGVVRNVAIRPLTPAEIAAADKIEE